MVPFGLALLKFWIYLPKREDNNQVTFTVNSVFAFTYVFSWLKVVPENSKTIKYIKIVIMSGTTAKHRCS